MPIDARPQNISVIIPAYNAASFISSAIDSVITQTYPASEILVIDDGSRDETAEVIRRLPPPVRLLQKSNGGPASARNRGAREAAGDWLAFLDADDSWRPEKLTRQMALAEPGVGLIHCLFNKRHAKAVPDHVTFDMLWKRNCIACSTVVIRKRLFLDLGGFDEDPELVGVEDYHLWMRAAAASSSIVTLQEVLINYTRAPGSLTQQVERFAHAELTNVRKIAALFGIDHVLLKRRELEILDEYGRELLHYRNLAAARRVLRSALQLKFSLSRFAWWSAASLPSSVLQLYGSQRSARS